MSIDQQRNQRQKAYEILGFSVMLRDKNELYSAAILVKNVLYVNYVANISAQHENLLPNAYLQFLPRTFERRIGLELRYHWL